MKLNSKELVKLVQMCVREELKRSLPRMVNEVLSEKYIRNLVGNAPKQENRGSNLTEVLSTDDDPREDPDHVPEALGNSHKGIYQKSSLMKGKMDESRRREMLAKIMGEDNVSFFEGTEPLPSSGVGGGSSNVALGESQQKFGEEGIPEDALAKLGINFSAAKETLDAVSKPRGQVQLSEDSQLRALEMKRKALDVPASQWKR